MSAELLRRAATTLRTHAEDATPGPWEHVDYHGSDHPESTYRGCGSVITMGEDVMGGDIAAPNGDLYPRSGYSPRDDMALIALMHPPVALALAKWLDDEAFQCERENAVHVFAASVAHAILREDS